MLTFIEAISLAGERAKQNDDACGFARDRAWVIDGATDLHDAPLTGAASDAGWIAHFANAYFHGAEGGDLVMALRGASAAAAETFRSMAQSQAIERWQSPIASVLVIEAGDGMVSGADLGDCRVFALDADGAVHVAGGPGDAGDNEAKLASQQTDAHKPLLERTQTILTLRRGRAAINQLGGSH